MALSLSQLKASAQRSKKRVGRGDSSGRGTYSGRGLKGQRSRSGGKGGLKRRGVKQFLQQIPKSRGFKSKQAVFHTVRISDIAKQFDGDAVINPTRLHAAGLVPTTKRIKVLNGTALKKKLHVQAHAFSQSAIDAITKAGGSYHIIPILTRAPKKHQEKNNNA